MTTPGPLRVDGLLLDIDGVLTVSTAPLPGAVAAVARLHDAGLPVRLITNTTAYTRAAVGAGLRRAGFGFRDDDILTAPVAAARYVLAAHPGARVFVLGDARHDDLSALRLVELDERPDVILVSGADVSYAFDTLNRVYRALLDGAALVSMHRNLSWMTDEGECLDAGAYLLGLERATLREAIVTGKPARTFFEAGLASLGVPAERAGMVGDDLEYDVLAAQAMGLAGVLVRTGKFRQELVDRSPARPHHIVDSVVDLPALLGL